LEKLNFQTLHTRHRHSDALFLIYVYNGAKCCPCLLEIVGIRVPARNILSFRRSVAPPATVLQLDMFRC
jgi:hypothetical protein